ncbi:MAG TPA: hypothetical protein VFF11_09635 [Candidatus Binatia bacterium]|nr:hypothetical protein [Candidatus Binatia bacterium]
MRIPGVIPLWPAVLSAVIVLLFPGETSAFAQRNAQEPKSTPMRRLPPGTNSVCWHTILVTPKPGVPKIHFYDKLNPVWWLQNADDPVPPDWYRPDDKHRITKWRFRNPFHNFDHYVIGVADKKFYRSGRYPEQNSNPNGGWDFEMARRKLVLLPFVSYERSWCTFYFGWREHGAFGMSLRFHRKTTTDSSQLESEGGNDASDKPSSLTQHGLDEAD